MMPLVRTPMIAPPRMYERLPARKVEPTPERGAVAQMTQDLHG